MKNTHQKVKPFGLLLQVLLSGGAQSSHSLRRLTTWVHTKTQPFRCKQSKYHRQKFYLHEWLLAQLCVQHWDTFSSLYAYNPFLPSNKVFFVYWYHLYMIKQTYLEGKHDPTEVNKDHCAIVETTSLISLVCFFLTAFSSLHLQHSRCPILEPHTSLLLLLFMGSAAIPAFF